MLCDVRCILVDARGERLTHDVACGGGKRGVGCMYQAKQRRIKKDMKLR